MKIAVSPLNGSIVPSSAVALSSSRSEVVPTATMRPPLASPHSARPRMAGDAAPFGMHPVPGRVIVLTGKKVPAPTCSVIRWNCDARARNAASSADVKCNPAVGAATAPSLAREHGLVVGGVALIGRALAGDVRRQRRTAEIGDGLIERGP